MIRQDTYISPNYESSTVGRVLSSFSAVDESVQRDLPDNVKNKLFVKLAIKIASFCTLHGLEIPEKFISKIFQAGEEEIFDTVNSFLELGCYDPNIPAPRELQQEILHFSRIVDLENLSSISGIKRIRNSTYLESFLKVYSELVTVMRSRLIQRGKKLDKPLGVGTKTCTEEIEPGFFINSLMDNLSNYLLIIKAERRRDAKDLNYQFTCLLSYLTPLEAYYALVNYVIEEEFKKDVTMVIIYNPTTSTEPILLSWKNSIGTIYDDYLSYCKATLPNMVELSKGNGNVDYKIGDNSICTVQHTSNNHISVAIKRRVNDRLKVLKNLSLTKFIEQNFSISYFLDISKKLLTDSIQQFDITSIESGHIHLDRNIDIDQQIGFELGKISYEYLKSVQQVPPNMCPMIDDDHVLIRLRPKDYEVHMTKIMPDIDYRLIPESSPIIRAIVVELYHRIRSSDKNKLLKNIGDNLYISVDDTTTCEIFEDVNGRCDSGCVIFEVALLIYRTKPDLFDTYFNEKFKLKNIHTCILDILNEDTAHDDKYKVLKEFQDLFKEFVNPNYRNNEVTRMVDDLFNNKTYSHLNILEDYYEHQQSKVRKMISILNIPIRLFSLTFNTQTGRIVLQN